MEEKTTIDEKVKNEHSEYTENETEEDQESSEKAEENLKQKSSKRKKSQISKLEEQIEQLTTQIEELKEQNLRLNAEFQNQRKRLNRERENIIFHASENLIESILPVIDDFQRSLKASEDNKSFENFLNGIRIIYNKLFEILSNEGLKPIKSIGEKFDYNLHEAILMVDQEGVESETILEEVVKGYYYKDKVLRHAQVVVAK
jgi:molecular chaperone GrpE